MFILHTTTNTQCKVLMFAATPLASAINRQKKPTGHVTFFLSMPFCTGAHVAPRLLIN